MFKISSSPNNLRLTMGNAISSEGQQVPSPSRMPENEFAVSDIEPQPISTEVKDDVDVKLECSSSESLSPREDHVVTEIFARHQANLEIGFMEDRKKIGQFKEQRISSASSKTEGSKSSTISPENLPTTTKTLRKSISFDERFKNKVSIYSKVSGCRMTNLPDYTIVKQIRVVALAYVTKGNPHEASKIKFAYEKMKNGGLQIITDDSRLSTALSSLSYFAGIPCKMTFPNSPRVVGFVKNLPVDMEPAELKREIRKALPEVYSVRYITERAAARSRPSQGPCAFISFNLRYLPGSVWVYGKEFEIQVPNPMQCSRCCRYGHQGKQCRADVRCPVCSNLHPKHQCSSSVLRCVNCKGAHSSTSHECTIWQQGKLMNELRYRGGLTAEAAIDVASGGKITHKKHSFTAPEEYFDNLENCYLGGGDGSHGSDEENVNGRVMNSNNGSPADDKLQLSKSFFHPKYVATQQFLDLMTDFFLRLTNPTESYTNEMLMPGFDEDSFMLRLNKAGQKKPSVVAEQFKLCVLRAFEEHEIGTKEKEFEGEEDILLSSSS